MKSIHIYKRFQLSYAVAGMGEHVVIAFPGIALEASSFDSVIHPFKDSHRFYILDLFYAGESKINGNNPTQFDSPDLTELLNDFITSKKIISFSLWGFSIGARIVMMLYPSFKRNVRQVVLLAPDGIVVNKWYSFATRTSIGHWLFKHACHSVFIRKLFIHLAKQVTDLKAYQRIHAFLSDSESLKMIYLQWMTYRFIQPNNSHFEDLNSLNDVVILLATKDEFLKGLSKEKVLKKLPHSTIIEVNDSHLFLNSRTAKILHAAI